MCSRLGLLASFGVLLALGSGALADKRVALVIGNSAYTYAPQLPNPVSDATAMSVLLEGAGFEVVETRNDLGNHDMRRAITDFSQKTRDADIAIVFYAGHGIEVDGTNFLIPLDARLERDIDVEDEAIALDRVLKMIEPARRLRLVILDACRDNPFARSMKRTMLSRSVGRGLAKVEPMTANTLIAFAAKAGSTAADGDGMHSPFTTALLKHMVVPGLDLRFVFGRVRDDVLSATANRQEPFLYGSLGGGEVALVAGLSGQAGPDLAGASDPHAAPPSSSGPQAWQDYEAAAKVGMKEAWDALLAVHTTGFYANLARAQRAKLMATSPETPAAVPAPAAPAPAVAVVTTTPRVEPVKRTRTIAPAEPERPVTKRKRVKETDDSESRSQRSHRESRTPRVRRSGYCISGTVAGYSGRVCY
jgi:hypothetical protein